MSAALTLAFDHPLRSFDLSVGLRVADETFALVGPSGAGKSSVLRMVAGLVRPKHGTVRCGERVWLDTSNGLDLPPEHRSVGLVVQHYALFPHLTVRQNVGFGGAGRVDELLERMRISHLADTRPNSISGGEAQRVALARALARKPAVLLLDEPLSALDADTRATVRTELRLLLAELGLPTVVVTHDFDDAATLADRIGVIVDGKIRQIGTAAELVSRPVDPFIARFSGASLLEGAVARVDGGLTEVVLDGGTTVRSVDSARGRVAVAIHPWDVTLSLALPADSALNHIRAPITAVALLGNRARVTVGPLTAEITTASLDRLDLREGVVIVASFKATASRLIPLT